MLCSDCSFLPHVAVDWWIAIKPSSSNRYLYVDSRLQGGGFVLATSTVDGVGEKGNLKHGGLVAAGGVPVLASGHQGAVLRTINAMVPGRDGFSKDAGYSLLRYNDQTGGQFSASSTPTGDKSTSVVV
jgi:hypothetical protein